MALKGQQVMGAVLVLMVMVLGGAQAQSSTCINALMGLSPCLNFVSGNSSTPTPACCSQLSNVVQTQPRCLCSLLNGNLPNIGVTINQTLAVTLPGACRVQTPPITLCNGVANGPAGAPASAPTVAPTGTIEAPTDPSEGTPEVQAPTAPLTPTTPSGTGSGSGSGSKATPSTNNNASDGNKFGAPTYLLLLVVFFGMKI